MQERRQAWSNKGVPFLKQDHRQGTQVTRVTRERRISGEIVGCAYLDAGGSVPLNFSILVIFSSI